MSEVARLRAVVDWLETIPEVGEGHTVHIDGTSIWFHRVSNRGQLGEIARRLPDCVAEGGRDPVVKGHVEIAGQLYTVYAFYSPGMLGRSKKETVVVVTTEDKPDLAGLLAEFPVVAGAPAELEVNL